jgi:phage terminase Nu1 subunit (DNA packaging protein)
MANVRAWDSAIVRTWLESRLNAAHAEQDRADRRGRGHEDDYDKAAAEEWVCRVTKSHFTTDSQAQFEGWLRELLAKDEYRATGIHDDRRFEREVRSYLRKLVKMTKANEGFENTSRYQ